MGYQETASLQRGANLDFTTDKDAALGVLDIGTGVGGIMQTHEAVCRRREPWGTKEAQTERGIKGVSYM